jgi:GntR family transcriptional regulator / MocR family aminotransferase
VIDTKIKSSPRYHYYNSWIYKRILAHRAIPQSRTALRSIGRNALGLGSFEDDYDSEYRFSSRPIASLQGMDTDARVIYVGTFSKVMFPALRLGYIVVPKDLVAAFCGALDAVGIFSSPLYQAVLTDFISEGHFARHIRRMRMLYLERRRVLVRAVHMQMSDILEIVGDEAGMHLAAFLPLGVNEAVISRNTARRASPRCRCPHAI